MPFRYDPTFWRERAEQARAVAAAMKNPNRRQLMLRIAEEYEKLAGGRNKATPRAEDETPA